MPQIGPRLVIAGTSSGVGKTTIATGLMAALNRRGHVVGAAKVGPDFIDPGYHAIATGRPPRNLDAWICGDTAIPALAARAGAGADLLVVEGVMGLFDGSADGGSGSTAAVAKLLDAPVVLVVDAAAMSTSVAALVHGFASFDPDVRLAGVMLNRVGSDSHETMLREALAPLGVPVIGSLRRDEALTWRDRHLGLVPVIEQPEEVRRSLRRLSAQVERSVDLDAVVRLARSALTIDVAPLPEARRRVRTRIAVASGQAFSFVYPDNLERLEEAGAELLPFDPVNDRSLPDGIFGLYAGGGFPEIYAEALAANEALLADVTSRARAGLAIWAECGGMLWLSRRLGEHALAGLIDADATMTDRLTLGYRSATACADSPLAATGAALRGHEFHYSAMEPQGDALQLTGRFGTGRAGFASPTMLASYLHLHLGADPAPAERFVATTAAAAPVASPR